MGVGFGSVLDICLFLVVSLTFPLKQLLETTTLNCYNTTSSNLPSLSPLFTMTSTFTVSANDKSTWRLKLEEAQLDWQKYRKRSVATRPKVECKEPIDATGADDSDENKRLVEAYEELLENSDGMYVDDSVLPLSHPANLSNLFERRLGVVVLTVPFGEDPVDMDGAHKQEKQLLQAQVRFFQKKCDGLQKQCDGLQKQCDELLKSKSQRDAPADAMLVAQQPVVELW